MFMAISKYSPFVADLINDEDAGVHCIDQSFLLYIFSKHGGNGVKEAVEKRFKHQFVLTAAAQHIHIEINVGPVDAGHTIQKNNFR